MKKSGIWIMAMYLAFAPMSARADVTAQTLLSDCDNVKPSTSQLMMNKDSEIKVGACLGYMSASMAYLMILQAAQQQHGEQPKACVPAKATVDSFRAAFVYWVAAHSEELDNSAAPTVIKFAAFNYPCPKK
jgi:Rap1a immunity proteins